MSSADYNYPIAQCDVPQERRAALEAYRAKRQQWLAWLDTDEHHAIWTTISSMVWTDASFRTLTQAAVDGDETCLGNTLLAEQIINGHVATQVLAIRRLVDNRADVISLRRLIKDVRRNYKLFTRENYVCHDGLPYDYEAVQRKQMQERVGTGAFWAATTGPEAHGSSHMAHEQFDRLAGIDPGSRSREDRLPTRLLDTIEGWLDGSGADALAESVVFMIAPLNCPTNVPSSYMNSLWAASQLLELAFRVAVAPQISTDKNETSRGRRSDSNGRCGAAFSDGAEYSPVANSRSNASLRAIAASIRSTVLDGRWGPLLSTWRSLRA